MIDQIKIRELLKKTENKFISENKASRILNVDKKAAVEILTQLDEAGYIEKTGIDGLWRQSIRGKILAYKRIKKEFRVDTLQRQLSNLIKRLKIVNSSNEYPDRVNCAIVTTEYPIQNKSGGICIAYSLVQKGFSEKEYHKAADKLRERHNGNFSNIVEYYCYPHEAIRIFLKSRSPVLKLKQFNIEEIKSIDGYEIL
jgi:hypothetical protein